MQLQEKFVVKNHPMILKINFVLMNDMYLLNAMYLLNLQNLPTENH